MLFVDSTDNVDAYIQLIIIIIEDEEIGRLTYKLD